MRRPALLAIVAGTLLATLVVAEEGTRLNGETTLRATPAGGDVLGLLTPDAPVTELERQGDWVKVKVEGWVRTTALAGVSPTPSTAPATTAPAATPATAPAAVAAAASAGTAPLEGMLGVELGSWPRKKKIPGSGRQVWLLPASFDLVGAGQVSAEDRARLDQLEAEAERLAKEASKAMHGSNLTESTRSHDALMAERRRVLEQRSDVLAVHHGRREAAARQAALSIATCDSRGFFMFPAVAPGSYRLYARLIDRDLDLEWIEAVEIGAAGARIQLDETRVLGLPPKPS